MLLLVGGAALYAIGAHSRPGYADEGQADATSDLTFSAMAVYAAASQPPSVSLAPQPLTKASDLPLVQPTLALTAADVLRLAAARAGGQEPLPPAAPAEPTVTPTATPTPTPSPEPSCDRGVSAIYCVYTVQTGDTLSKIAKDFGLRGTAGVSPWELVVDSNKPDITSAEDFIQPGQKLRIPLANGVIHVVVTGESLSQIAAGYGVTATAIAGAPGNQIPGGVITIGQEIFIPDPQRIPPVRTAAAPTPEPTATPIPTQTPEPQPTALPPTIAPASGSAAASATAGASSTPSRTPTPSRGTPAAAGTPSRSAAGFIWPATGPISSYFGPSHPLGIDIDLFNNPNAPIVAAAAGTVTFAGGNPCCSYGLYVIIDHGNGYTTLYAHLSSILVSAGQRVSQGQLLGYGGKTGYATGNHLHFEVRLNDVIINPLSVLP